MSTKCDKTGHFFGYYPEHDIGFTCFECLEQFGSSGRRPPNPWGYSTGGLNRESRKRRSLHLPPPPPPNVTEEPVIVSEHDESGRRRSKPWRCLQQRCKLLACDRCSENLINPEFVSQARGRDLSELQAKRNSLMGAEVIARAGAATPPEQRARRELGASTHEPLATAAIPVAEPQVSVLEPDAILESDTEEESDDEAALEALRMKLVYRRAGHVATSALRNYQHRDTVPSYPSYFPVKELPPTPPREEIRRLATAIPEHLISTGPGKQMASLEVDSSGSDEELFPKLAVRSATQAANQAMMRNVNWRQRAAGAGAVP